MAEAEESQRGEQQQGVQRGDSLGDAVQSGAREDEGSILAEVLSSVQHASQTQSVARINEDALSKFVQDGIVSHAKYKRAATKVALPLKFDDNAQEINFHCLMALLSFGGAYDPGMHALTQTSVEDSIKFGLIGSHLAREKLDATWMKNAHVGSVSETFKIPAREAMPSTIPGVTVDKPGALVAHAQMLTSVLNETGDALLSRGYADMAQFVMHAVSTDHTVEGLVRALTMALPTFEDREIVEGEEVPLLKNAQMLASDLSLRLGHRVGELKLEGMEKLTAVADADVITALIAVDVIERAPTSSSGDAPLFRPEDTAELRVVAVQACHRLAELLGDDVQPHELSLYLRRVGKREQYRDVPRFVPRVSRAL